MKNITHIPSYKKIGSKLWSWQCSRFSDKYGGHDVINYVNELKLRRTQLDIWEIICDKFNWNRLGSFGVLARTDRQTDTRTNRQPCIFQPERSQYIQSIKWLNVKTQHIYKKRLPENLFLITLIFWIRICHVDSINWMHDFVFRKKIKNSIWPKNC